MIHLSIRFNTGRFHATPWQHHVNEGVPEWPPSPWRIVRAAVSALYTRSLGIPFDAAYDALLALTGAPSFTLPAATAAHTRHYLSKNEVNKAATALTIDAFVATDEPVIVHWPCELTKEQRALLASAFRRIAYLGRAESWCEIELLSPDANIPDPNCFPSDGTAVRGGEIVRVLCLAPNATREDLERTTAQVQKEGWLDPPGSRWVFYHRAGDALRGAPRAARPAAVTRRLPTVAQLVLGGSVLPLATDCVPFAAKIRRALMRLHGVPSMSFSGKDASGPLKSQHRHAHFVPFPGDPRHRNRLTNVLIYCPEGLTPSEQDAILGLTVIHQDEDRPEVAVQCNGFGDASDFSDQRLMAGAPAAIWRSATPFLFPRHPRHDGRESQEEQIARELSIRGLPRLKSLHTLSETEAAYRTVQYDPRRSRHAPWPTAPMRAFEMELAEPVSGPILLGGLSHYGFGLFVAVP